MTTKTDDRRLEMKPFWTYHITQLEDGSIDAQVLEYQINSDIEPEKRFDSADSAKLAMAIDIIKL